MTTASGMGFGSVSISKRNVSRTETNRPRWIGDDLAFRIASKTRSKGQGKATHCKRRRLHFQKFYHEPGLVDPGRASHFRATTEHRGWPSVQKLRGDHVPRCKIPPRLRQSFSRPATGVPWKSSQGRSWSEGGWERGARGGLKEKGQCLAGIEHIPCRRLASCRVGEFGYLA